MRENHEILNRLKGGLIVSCQALENEPLHSAFIMGRMAYAAMLGGASGIRANTPEDILAIRAEVPLPVIGLHKRVFPDCGVFITPTMEEVVGLVGCGADIIAMDATDRLRPDGSTIELFFRKARDRYPEQLFMADVSTAEEGLAAEAMGFDLVGTTLSGYTPYTQERPLPDFALIRRLSSVLRVPLVAEGGIWTPEELRRAFNEGAFSAVVGTAITRPMEITRRFASALPSRVDPAR